MAAEKRLTIDAALRDFQREINRLIRFNRINQERFLSGQLNQAQIDLLVESVFFNSYRHYENFIRESFLLCCLGKVSKRPKVRSFLNAKSFEHSEYLIKGTKPFLDWANPEELIRRAETFLENGYPFKLIIAAYSTQLKVYKKLRNHVAHDSIESLNHFKGILSVYFGYLPLAIPTVGSFLMQASLNNAGNNLLDDFFKTLGDITTKLAE